MVARRPGGPEKISRRHLCGLRAAPHRFFFRALTWISFTVNF
jgi:hypothetical protein